MLIYRALFQPTNLAASSSGLEEALRWRGSGSIGIMRPYGPQDASQARLWPH